MQNKKLSFLSLFLAISFALPVQAQDSVWTNYFSWIISGAIWRNLKDTARCYIIDNKPLNEWTAEITTYAMKSAAAQMFMGGILWAGSFVWQTTAGEFWNRIQIRRDLKKAIKFYESENESATKKLPILPQQLEYYKAFILNPELSKTDNGKITPSNLLLYGKPGGGKTTFIDNLVGLASQSPQATMIFKFPMEAFQAFPTTLLPYAFKNFFTGCRDLAKANGKKAACVVIEEIDLLGGKDRNVQDSRQKNALKALLKHMGNADPVEIPVSVIATTNRDVLDEALQDRFHYEILMGQCSFEEGIQVFAQTIAEGQKEIGLVVNWKEILDAYQKQGERDGLIYGGPLYLDYKLGYRRWTFLSNKVLLQSKIKMQRQQTKTKFFDCTDLVKEELDQQLKLLSKKESFFSPSLITSPVHKQFISVGKESRMPSPLVRTRSLGSLALERKQDSKMERD